MIKNEQGLSSSPKWLIKGQGKRFQGTGIAESFLHDDIIKEKNIYHHSWRMLHKGILE